jgi:hypothetical protein
VVHLRSYIKFALVAVLCTAGVVLADWDVNEPALYYQLPDSEGWSVYSEWGTGAADDWTATTTAPITDIHFWGGWENDYAGDLGNLLIQIFDNDTSGSFPMPGNQLWEHVVLEYEYTSRKFDNIGWQGWYDPRGAGDWDSHNHEDMFQYSIEFAPGDAFLQEAEQTYWIMISMDFQGGVLGWNSAESVSGSSAVFWDTNGGWTELMTLAGYQDPRTPLDMAFVLAPEPTTLLLLGFGSLALLRKRKK